MPRGLEGVRAVTAQVRTGSCEGPVTFETTVTVDALGNAMGGAMPTVLPQGTYYFSATATGADCAVLASGCVAVALPVSSGPVTVTLTAMSGPSICGRGTMCDGNGRCVGTGVDMGPEVDMGRPDVPELEVDLGMLDTCMGEGTPCGGGGGTCRMGRCCVGCWDGAVCRGGNTSAACGTGGATCSTCMGSDTCAGGRCVPPPPPEPATFSLGTLNSFLLFPDGRWYGAGDDMFKQRGQPREMVVPEGSFEPYTGAIRLRAIASATTTTCGIEADTPSLYCWGTNAYGTLGIGMAGVVERPMLTRVGSDRWRTVSAGSEHVCGILVSGQLLCWGRNTEGRLGNGTTSNASSPTVVSGGGTWTAVSAGDEFTCAIRSDGTLYCWGGNDKGQLGLGRPEGATTPQRVGSQTWKSLSAGVTHVCAIHSDDTLWCWGEHTNGRLGIEGVSDDVRVPTRVPTPAGASAWVAVAAGQYHTCALVRVAPTDRTFDLYCWGSNVRGQAALGEAVTQANTPTRVSAGWHSIAAGWEHTCGVQDDGGRATYLCWGDNEAAALGIGTTLRENRYEPTPVMPRDL
jgi:alpha-tubulin suppressor-like RCC1 family protein